MPESKGSGLLSDSERSDLSIWPVVPTGHGIFNSSVMRSFSPLVIDTDVNVTAQELKFLLNSILDHHVNVRARFRMHGEVWSDHFLRVLVVTEKGAIFNDERTNKITSIKFLTDIAQFELDKTYESYEARSPYTLHSI